MTPHQQKIMRMALAELEAFFDRVERRTKAMELANNGKTQSDGENYEKSCEDLG